METLIDSNLTDEMIRDLRDEARQAGDMATYDDCKMALTCDPGADDISSARLDARKRILKVINSARAMHDNE